MSRSYPITQFVRWQIFSLCLLLTMLLAACGTNSGGNNNNLSSGPTPTPTTQQGESSDCQTSAQPQNTAYMLSLASSSSGDTHRLTAVSSSGQSIWQQDIASDRLAHASGLEVRDGIAVYFLSLNEGGGTFTSLIGAFDATQGRSLWTNEAKNQAENNELVTLTLCNKVAFLNSDTTLWAYDALTGKLLWQKSLYLQTTALAPRASSKAVVVILGENAADESCPTEKPCALDSVYAFEPRTGAVLWKKSYYNDNYKKAQPRTLTITEQSVYVCLFDAIKRSDIPVQIDKLSLTDGKSLWSTQLEGQGSHRFETSVNGNTLMIYLEDLENNTYLVGLSTQDGKNLWKTKVDEYIQTSGQYLYGSSLESGKEDSLCSFEAANGKERWCIEPEGSFGWIVANDQICYVDQGPDGLIAYQQSDGKLLWRYQPTDKQLEETFNLELA